MSEPVRYVMMLLDQIGPNSFVIAPNNDSIVSTLIYDPNYVSPQMGEVIEAVGAVVFYPKEELHLIGGRKYWVDVCFEDKSVVVTEFLKDEK